MIAVLDHTLLRTKVTVPFAVRDNGKTRKTDPRAKTVMLVNTVTKMDVNRNPTVRFVKLKPTTTKLDKHRAKIIVMPDRTLIPIKPSVPFATKDYIKTRTINQIVKRAQKEDTTNRRDVPI